jgi:hypothetical protein
MAINVHCFENMSVPMKCKDCSCYRAGGNEGLSAERLSHILSNRTKDIVLIDTPNQVNELVDWEDVADIDYHIVAMSEGIMKFAYVTDRHGIFSPLLPEQVIGMDVVEALPNYWYGMLKRYYIQTLEGRFKTAMLMKIGMIRLVHTFPMKDKKGQIIGALIMILPPSIRFQAGLEEIGHEERTVPISQVME